MVAPHSGEWMTVPEAERLAALWCAGQPLDDLPQWRTAMQVLVRELADTRAALDAATAARTERESRFAGWFRELPSAMSYRLWEQGGHEPRPGDVALYEG